MSGSRRAAISRKEKKLPSDGCGRILDGFSEHRAGAQSRRRQGMKTALRASLFSPCPLPNAERRSKTDRIFVHITAQIFYFTSALSRAYRRIVSSQTGEGGWLRVFEKKSRRQAPFFFSTRRILGQIKVRSRGDVNKSSRGGGGVLGHAPPPPRTQKNRGL